MNRAIIWDFDETLARRSGGWRHTLVDALDLEAPGHGITPSDVEPALRHGFPWHEPQPGQAFALRGISAPQLGQISGGTSTHPGVFLVSL